MADYWQVDKVAPEFADDKGVSQVLIHNERAQQIFDELADVMFSKETDLMKYVQPQLCHPVKKGLDYSNFWKHWYLNPDNAVEYYFFPGARRILYLQSVSTAKKIVKRVLKMMKLR